MASQEQPILCFVTWNTRGIKTPKKFPDVLSSLSDVKADVAFIQETHIGPDDFKQKGKGRILQNVEGWNVYFTVHSSRSKGVAILIRKDVPFEYIHHDEDCSGGYIVLFCRLYGELYTLVNVYNHKDDRYVLGQLKQYLMETAKGVLVVGGDFNTVLDPSIDRKPPSSRKSPLKSILDVFTESLSVIDTWSHIHADTNNESRFTWQQGASSSRIDLFFLRKETMRQVHSITVKNVAISDHNPLVLTLPVQTQTQTTPRSEPFDRRPGKISGAEILSAIKSLHGTEEYQLYMSSLPVTTACRTYMNDVNDYRTLHALIERLKLEYNDFLNTLNVPEKFKHSRNGFNLKYLIFAQILATRLMSLISFKSNICDSVIHGESPKEIKWSFLKARIENLSRYYTQKGSKHTNLPPPPDFRVLDCLLPKVQGSSEDFRDLLPGCPLAKAIFNLALKHLEEMFCNSEKDPRTRKYYKQGLPIHTQQRNYKKNVRKVFQQDSGIRLRIRWDTLRFK